MKSVAEVQVSQAARGLSHRRLATRAAEQVRSPSTARAAGVCWGTLLCFMEGQALQLQCAGSPGLCLKGDLSWKANAGKCHAKCSHPLVCLWLQELVCLKHTVLVGHLGSAGLWGIHRYVQSQGNLTVEKSQLCYCFACSNQCYLFCKHICHCCS